MSDGMRELSEVIARIAEDIDSQPSFSWAVVTSVSPLRIRYDAHPEPIDGTPDSIVGGLSVGDRVWVQRAHRRDVILGRAVGTRQRLILYGKGSSRDGTKASFGDEWHDTDGKREVWKGATNGEWRRSVGNIVAPAAAWQMVGGTGNTTVAGRTITMTVPVRLEENETLNVIGTAHGNGYGWSTQVNVAPGDTSTVITVRMMQILSSDTQALSFRWEIVEIPI